LQEQTKLPFISIIDETAKEISQRAQGKKARVGILATDGTVQTGLYHRALEKNNLVPVNPCEQTQAKCMDIIYNDVKRASILDVEKFTQLCDDFSKKQKLDFILLGCTELSAFGSVMSMPNNYVDALEVLTERSIEMCGYTYKKAKSIYYIGPRQTDIAVSFDGNKMDGFFKGSITRSGNNEGGNIAYNVTTGHQPPRYCLNHKTNDSKFVIKACKEVIAQDSNAKFMTFNAYWANLVPKEYQDRVICQNDGRVLSILNSKFEFKKLIDGKLAQAGFKILKGLEVIKLIRDGTIPHKEEAVIQLEYDGVPNRTIIATKQAFKDPGFKSECISIINPNTQYVVSNFIEDLVTVSMHIQISDTEIGIYPPSVEIKNGPTYAGNDLSAFQKLDGKTKDECFKIAYKFGEMIRDMKELEHNGEKISNIRNRGYFCLDLLVPKDGSSVFVIEVNARFAGCTGLLNILSHKAGVGSVYEHSYKCFTWQKTNFKQDFAKLDSRGIKRFAKAKIENGLLRSAEKKDINREGLDQTTRQDKGIYTHTVFEE